MDYGLLNRGSLLFGLIAIILPIINLMRENKSINKNWSIFSIASASACAISLFMQIFYINHLVNIEDWTAMMDTLSTVALASALLLVITITLNAIVCSIYCKIKY